MTRVGWLADQPGYVGGAERTQEEFRAAAPRDVETVDCQPGKVDRDCDVFAVHNALSYSLKDLRRLEGKRVVKFWNDIGNWYAPQAREWFDKHAEQVCCSELQARHMHLEGAGRDRGGAHLIPPPVNLEPFRQAAVNMNGDRRGTCSVAQWRALNKGSHAVAAWGQKNQTPIDFYGGGPFAPPGSREISYRGLPALLARYERFVFLPQVIEPFGRLVAEAWATGLEIVTNELVGALEWIQHKPEALSTAGEDYWRLVLDR